MSDAPSRPVVQMIRRVAGNPSLGDRTDRELLALFVAGGGDAAFEAIVRRHGPMVLEVCRALLPCEADAEDAFQATFLVLARKAGSIREASSLASWLHGVAHRSARRAREAFARRRRHEAQVPQRPDPVPGDDLTWSEVRGVLHEELAGLPDRLRAVLVLCYLLGKTQDEAAAELHLPRGTLKGRLERGRALLRSRLLRRGLESASVLALSAWQPASAVALAPTLVDASVLAATRLVRGQAVIGIVSDRATALAAGVQRTMLLSKLKGALVALVLVGVTGLGAYGLSPGSGEDHPTARAGGERPETALPAPRRADREPPGARVAAEEFKTDPVTVSEGNERADPAFVRLPEPLDLTPMFLGDGLLATVAPGRRPKEDGLVLEVEFERGERLLGEAVLVRCSIANSGPKPVTLSYGHRSEQRNTIFFDITGPDGKPVPRLFLAERDSLGPQPRVREPGWRLVEWYNLTDAYGLTKPGDYTVGTRYESDGTSVNAGGGKRTDQWKGKIERSVGTVKIVEPSRPEDRAALAWLVANSPFGAVHPEYRYASLFPPDGAGGEAPLRRVPEGSREITARSVRPLR